jgi:hypothetical protein
MSIFNKLREFLVENMVTMWEQVRWHVSLPSRSRQTSKLMAPMAASLLYLELDSEVAVERSWVFGEAQVSFLIELEYS